jgi:hypothetical protein
MGVMSSTPVTPAKRPKRMKKLANTSTKKSDTVEIEPSFMPVVAVFADDPLVRRGKMFSSSSVLTVNVKVLQCS